METKEIMKALRKERGLSAKEVAEGCEMSLGVYQKYESGERGVGTPALCKLADFYQVSTDYLLGRNTAPNPIRQLTQEQLERRLVAAYFRLPQKLREELLHGMAAELERTDSEECSEDELDSGEGSQG